MSVAKKRSSAEQPESVPPAPRNRRAWVVVAYDIPDDRRRTKVMKLLEGYGNRVQYSVFECELRPADLDELKVRMRRLIRKEEDDVRFYPLCQSCLEKATALGKARLHRHAAFVLVS